MILSLPRKFVVFLLLIMCAPLYILLRYFYGRAFMRMILLALFLNLLAAPFLQGFFNGHPLAEFYASRYALDYAWTLFTLAVYVAPIHVAWLLFGWYAKDGRYDVDDPGRPLIPFIHPWLIDFPVAIMLPLGVAALAARGVSVPMILPEWSGLTLPDIRVSASWWGTAVLTSAAYLCVAVLTVEPPRLRLRRLMKMRRAEKRLRFDVARLAIRPMQRYARREDILAQRPGLLVRMGASG